LSSTKKNLFPDKTQIQIISLKCHQIYLQYA
jgi:hypothetical protein